MTVRQAHYQATVRGLVEKTEAGYAQVQTDAGVVLPITGLYYVPRWSPAVTLPWASRTAPPNSSLDAGPV